MDVSRHPDQAVADPAVLGAEGEMARLFRALDWSKTTVGPPEQWPQSLRTAVDIILKSRYAMFVWWGQELTNLYNDTYRPFLGKKHPQALGQSARDVWAEIWDLIGPRTEAVLKRAESTFDEALLLVMDRFGYREETYFTFSYSPICDDTGAVGGLFCAVTEETQRIIGERRLKLLREVAAACSESQTPEQVCVAAAKCMSHNDRDFPFALIYLTDGENNRPRCVAQVGINNGGRAPDFLIDQQSHLSAWPFEQAAGQAQPVVLDRLSTRFKNLPTGGWDRPPDRAVVMRLAGRGQTDSAGFLVAGVNPYLPCEEAYLGFVGLLAGQIGAGIASARAYQEERRRAEALAEIDRAKTAFFSNVSHEFRTPLTLMLGPLEEALNAGPETLPEKHKALTLAHRSALRMLRLVNTLLEFSRIEAGRVQASYEPTDLASFTTDLSSEFREVIEKAGLEFRIECPRVGDPVWIDRDMWEKIVLNLISNAFKFTLSGKIEVRLRTQDNTAILEVADTGIGISAEEIPHIFERFHRVEGTRGRTHEGTGIGLTLVQELVKLHKGTISVRSTLDVGTTFTVRIPLGTAHLPADRLRAERTCTSTAIGALPFVAEALRWGGGELSQDSGQFEFATEFGGELPLAREAGESATILLVDDNADMRDYIGRLLTPRYEVRTASDGVEALAAINQRIPDLVVSDVMMPRLDGFGLVRKIRSNPALASLPIILLSARAGEESSIEGLEVGADDYLIKPFSARELVTRITSNLKISKLRRGLEQQIVADLKAMTLLCELGAECSQAGALLDDILGKALDAAIALTGADKGNVQLLTPDSNALTIAIHRGFEEPFLKHFEYVRDDASACATAMIAGKRIIVDDVLTSEIFVGQPSQKIMLDAGARAVISTPLVSSVGNLLGMISTHFNNVHRPNERELHLLDLLVRQLADFLDRKRAEQIQKMLMHELQHRSNNLLSVVQVLAQRSLSDKYSLPQARKVFDERLRALARANRQVLKSNWAGVSFRELVTLELEAFGDHIAIQGEDLLIEPRDAQSFSLVLHELATNAAKYGALSNGSGKVQICWKISKDGNKKILKLEWRESGGPIVKPPARQGFGTSLLRAAFPNGGFDYAPDGLRWEIETVLRMDGSGAIGATLLEGEPILLRGEEKMSEQEMMFGASVNDSVLPDERADGKQSTERIATGGLVAVDEPNDSES